MKLSPRVYQYFLNSWISALLSAAFARNAPKDLLREGAEGDKVLVCALYNTT